MENEILNQLIKFINNIYRDINNESINECLKILNISISPFEEKEAELNRKNFFDRKDVYTKKIIEEVEKILTDEQKKIFYENLDEGIISFTSNEKIKKELIINRINNDKVLDYQGNVQLFDAKVLASLKDDSFKVSFIDKYKDNFGTEELEVIVESLADDNLKLDYINEMAKNEYCLSYFIISFKDDYLKQSLYEKYKDELDEYLEKDVYISSLNNADLKLERLKELGYKSIRLLYNINDEEKLMSIWDKVDERGKTIIVYKIKDISKKTELIKRINNDLANNAEKKKIFNIGKIIAELPEENMKVIIDECQNINLSFMDLMSIVEKLTNENAILNVLNKRGDSRISHYVRKNRLLSPECMLQNLELFLRIEDVKDTTDIRKNVEYLYETNNDILYSINWNILKPKYIETLGLNKINVLGSFEYLINIILEMTEIEYEAFYHALNHYIEKEGAITWQNAAYQMMSEINFTKVDGNDFCKYIDDINNVNLDNLLHILLYGDNLGINSLDDINNYDVLLKNRCNKNIIEGTLSQKKDAIFIKYFGLSDLNNNVLRMIRNQEKNGMGRIYNLYKKDINLIESEDLKQLFNFLEKVISTNDDEKLINIYNSRNEFGHIDVYKLERELKNDLLKLYNKQLLQVENLEMNQDGLYEAGLEFSALVTSVGAYVNNNPENYKTDWNRPSLASGHFCTSYIRNDMLGTAPIPHVMYGFSHMEPYSLLLSGSTDIYSSGAAFTSQAFRGEEYLGPDNQINQTAYNEKYKYNEMDFSRIQNGKRKEPDYILVFRRDGNIDNLEEARKASNDWVGLPIVVIDVDKCLKHEQELVKKMLNEYYINPSVELLNKIKTKIMNNKVTSSNFLENINELGVLFEEETENKFMKRA